MRLSSSNPVLRDDTFRGEARPAGTGGGIPGVVDPDGMTINGTISKGFILAILLAFTFSWTWSMTMNADVTGQSAGGIALGAGVAGFIVSIILSFKPKLAPVLAPVFALLEGALLGAVSAWYELGSGYAGSGGYPGIAFQAALATAVTFFVMLSVFRSGIIKVTDKFRAIVSVAMISVVGVYLIAFLLSLTGFRIPGIFDSGPIGIGFSLIVIGIASMMLLVDFDMVQRGAATGAPKYMEWYGAFALLVTLIWIYLEMMRLLAKLRR